MTVDPMRFSETYDPPPRDRPDASEYETWLDTLDHHTIGECDCADCQRDEGVAA